MQLRGGTAHFRIETGRWRQIPRELRVCRECSSGDIEDLNHWLLHCSAWQTSRFPLMKKMMEQYIDFPTLNDEAKVALILTAACLRYHSYHVGRMTPPAPLYSTASRLGLGLWLVCKLYSCELCERSLICSEIIHQLTLTLL